MSLTRWCRFGYDKQISDRRLEGVREVKKLRKAGHAGRTRHGSAHCGVHPRAAR
ncbi:hypothetical protein L843_1511 [Mycobacterium intracellulare MIN_061107_1834]|nr:hypothetical protein L843_1511 [Mycobacterium intracellulare MIN_061107_1834]